MKNGKDIVVLATEPAQGKTLNDIWLLIKQKLSEKDLAEAVALVSNQVGWLCHEVEDNIKYSAEQEKAIKNLNEWNICYKELVERILKEYPCKSNDIKAGIHYQISPFMKRHGFEDANGWWISREELEYGNK